MYRGPPPDVERRVSSRSAVAGVSLYVGLFLVLVVVSHPLATGALVAAGVGLYAARTILRRTTHERTFRLSRTELCLCLRLGPE